MEFSEAGDYFFKTKKLHDVYFIVGEEKERIGAVRHQLINQSQVWWAMLSEESDMVEKNDIHLPDIQPDVFMLLLKHCYGGLNDLSEIATDIVVSLCYCANKYLMDTLMNKIAKRLEPCTVDDLFPALHCLTIYNLKGVESSVQKMVQSNTREIFAHPQFLKCDEDSISFVAIQEPLDCYEIDLWNAVVMWAKHQAESCNGADLRCMLRKPLKYIRLLTMSSDDLCQKVFQNKVFTGDEILEVCCKKISSPESICDITEVRMGPGKIIDSKLFQITHKYLAYKTCSESRSAIVTRKHDILLNSISLRCRLYMNGLYSSEYFSLNQTADITVKIYRVIDFILKEPIEIYFENLKFPAIEKFSIALNKNGNGIVLKAHSKYFIELCSSKTNLAGWSGTKCEQGHNFKHGTLFCSQLYRNGEGIDPCTVFEFEYDCIDRS